MRRSVGKLYHLAEVSNLASILQHGLMSTERLLDLACVAKPERDALLRVHRPDNIRLSDSMVIRDQRPMPPAALVRALDGGLKPSDWYALLNSFVFPGPTRSAWRGSGAPVATAPRSCSRSTQMLYSIGSRLKLSCRRSIAATPAAKRPSRAGDFSSLRNLAAGGLADGPARASSSRNSAPLHRPCGGAVFDWCQQSIAAGVSKHREENTGA
jgi:hypothetical protein